MSGLVEKVKEKVRGRSRSNSRRSRDNPRQSGDYNRYDGRASQEAVHASSPHTSSPANPAWHVSKGGRNSTDAVAAPPVPSVDPRYASEVAHIQQNGSDPSSHPHRYTIDNPASDGIPRSSSTQQNQYHNSTNSQESSQTPVAYPYTVPRRKESLAHRSQKRNSTENHRLSQQMGEPQNMSRLSGSHTRVEKDLPPPPTSGNDLGTDIDRALADLSVNNRHSHNTTSNNTSHAADGLDEHVRLPPGFKIGNRETTSVDTQWMPAVTHEDIYHEKTEVIREAITKDIHVHHYYTYVQPVRVVEILPTKHYRLDEKTGRKIEIAAPAGWELPTDMRPRTENLGSLKGYSRHYLVDEEHPNGIPEPAPAWYDTDGVDGPLHIGQGDGRATGNHTLTSSRHGL